MIPDLPTDVDLLACYRSKDENMRVTALVALEKEIYKHLRDRKVALGEHDLNNAVRHTIDRLLAAPPNLAVWSELIGKAQELSELVAVEEIAWLKILPDLVDQTTRMLRANFGGFAEDDFLIFANKAFMKVREKYPNLFTDPKILRNTLFEAARNVAKDEIKARTAGMRDERKLQHFEDMPLSHGDASDEDGPKFEPSDRERNPEEHLLAKEKKHTLWQAISRMPKKHAQIFLDLHFHRMKHHEVAEKYGLKIGSIGVYNKRAAEMLLVALAGVIGMMMVMWNWAAWFGNQIQVAMLDSNRADAVPLKIEAHTAASAMLGSTEQITDEVKLANQFKNTFDSDSYLLFSTTNQLQNWYDNWLPDSTQPQFKVVYDRTSHTVHLIGYWDKAVRLDETIPVSNEANLTEILKTVRDHINKAAKR